MGLLLLQSYATMSPADDDGDDGGTDICIDASYKLSRFLTEFLTTSTFPPIVRGETSLSIKHSWISHSFRRNSSFL